MNRYKYLLLIIISAFLSGCATGSMRMIGNIETYKNGNCEIKIYQTKTQAIESGMVKEICIVEGSSAFSFDHSIEGAIKNNIKKLCACGVSKAYIESGHTQAQMGIKGVSYINLVGFK